MNTVRQFSGLFGKIASATVLLTFLVSPASATIISFHDLSDIVTVSFSDDPNGRASSGSDCGTGEVCTVILRAPTIAFPVNFNDLNIFDPNGTTISDTIKLNFSFDALGAFFSIIFTSDTDGSPLTPIPAPTPSTIENGTMQFGTSIVWNSGNPNAITDSVFFQSDIGQTVPEPSSIAILVLCIAGLATRTRKQ